MEILIIVANNIRNPYNLAVLCKRLYWLDCVQNNLLKLLKKSGKFADYYRIMSDLDIMTKQDLNRITIPVYIPDVLDKDLFAKYKLYRFELIKLELYTPYSRDIYGGLQFDTTILRERIIEMNGSNGSVNWNKGSNRCIDKQLRANFRLQESFELKCNKRGFLNLFNFEYYKSIEQFIKT